MQTVKDITAAAKSAVGQELAKMRPSITLQEVLKAALVLGLNHQTIEAMLRGDVGNVFTALCVRDYFCDQKGLTYTPFGLPNNLGERVLGIGNTKKSPRNAVAA